MPKSTYDVVIIGLDLPALIFGALAAKKGYRVLVIGHGSKDNVYEVEGFRFVRRPNCFFGFADSTPIREAFRDLALVSEMRNVPRQITPVSSFVFPQARLEVSHARGDFESEIAREFPEALEGFSQLFDHLAEVEKPIESLIAQAPILPLRRFMDFFLHRRLKKEVAPVAPAIEALTKGLLENPFTMAFLCAPLQFMSNIQSPHRFPVPFTRLLGHYLRGFYLVEWGYDALRELFLNRIKGNSGDVRPMDFADVITVRRGRIHEIDLRARDETIGASVLVAGTSLTEVLDLIPPEQAKAKYKAKVEAYLPSHYIVTLNIGARREVIPEGMARICFVCKDPRQPLEGANLLMVQIDPAMPPPDEIDQETVSISVSALFPVSKGALEAQKLEAFHKEMLETLRILMPFIDEHRLVLSPSAIGIDQKTGQKVVDKAGLVPIFAEPLPRSLDLVSWQIKTAYKNMLFLGEEVSGALGFEGQFLVADIALAHLWKMLPLKAMVS